MPTAIHGAEAIVAKAVGIASPEERAAYVAQACGDDAALRRQVEERVAAHLQARNGSPAHAHGHTPAAPPDGAGAGKRAPSLVIGMGVLMLVAVAGAIGLSVWAVRTQHEAERTVKEAAEAREHAAKVEEEAHHQRDAAEAARRATAEERDQAVAEAKAAQDAAEDMKAVLGFFQRRVLSPSRPLGWVGEHGKEVTLRQAVDAADAKVATVFGDRPLAEAAIREMLGSTYLDLDAPQMAVKEYERAVALREALQGEAHPDTVASRNQLAVSYRLAGRPEEAGRLYDPSGVSPAHASELAVRGELLLARKKPAEAEENLRKCLALRRKLRPDDWTTFDAESLVGQALLDQKKYAEAEPLLLAGYEGMKARESKIPAEGKVRLTRALEHLLRLYEAWGKEDAAARWRKELEAAVAAKKS